MSFILDALKKSEAERNRKSGPVLMDMRIAPARRQLPVWVWVIAIVLLANLVLLGYSLLRGGRKQEPAAPAVAAAPPAATPTAVAAAPTGALPPPSLPAPANATNATTDVAAPATGGVVMQSNAVVAPDSSSAPGTGTAASSPAPGPAAANLPSDDDLRAAGVALPELHLSLHVYDDVAANRFVLLNSSRLREGQETADGVMVERIDPAGVVLSWRGRRFHMHPGN